MPRMIGLWRSSMELEYKQFGSENKKKQLIKYIQVYNTALQIDADNMDFLDKNRFNKTCITYLYMQKYTFTTK